MLFFENRSFHHDRPREISFLISQRRPQLRQARKTFIDVEIFLPCERIFPLWKWTRFLTSSPSARSAEMFLKYHGTIIHQPRPQYALRTIDHTTLSVGHYPLVVLNTF